ncbi:MAG TPA: PqqD family peptide modification chaperone [Thermoanaerobaculia bacterium]|nr:PqqD family peptide modification chaperone [Thermoanaerobaculia bacterium]
MPANLSPPDHRRLGALLHQLGEGLRFVDYRQAERDCALLAEELARQVPDLARARFTAVPRGGLIVLGMLSYLLELRPEQLAPEGPPGTGPDLLVVVDDCALSGLRARQALAAGGSRRVVLAHLYSPPPLRQSLEADPRVERCLAARDLADRTAELLPDAAEREAWARRWRERLGERSWHGLAEPVAFAWSEPDRPLWNDLAGRAEDGWRLVPPHRCLKSRVRLGGMELAAAEARGTAPGREQDPQRDEPAWRLAPGIAWGDFDGVVWLCRSTDRQVFSLADTAADLWRWLMACGRPQAVVERATAVYGASAEVVRADLDELVERLSAEGLVEHRGGA